MRTKMTIDGIPVKDATRDLNLKIQPRDISGARAKDPSTCAAARAVKRQCHAIEARVYMSVTYILRKEKWERFLTPPALSREIVVIDRSGSHFSPGEYRMKAPFPAKRLGYQKPTGPKTTKGKKKRYRHLTANVRQMHTHE